MASQDALHQADLHRNAMTALAMSQSTEVRQLASAMLDSMKWLDANFTDLKRVFTRVSQLESELKNANDEIRKLKEQLPKS